MDKIESVPFDNVRITYIIGRVDSGENFVQVRIFVLCTSDGARKMNVKSERYLKCRIKITKSVLEKYIYGSAAHGYGT